MNYIGKVNFKDQIPKQWLELFSENIIINTEKSLLKMVEISNSKNKNIIPFDVNDMFHVFKLLDPDKIDVVILGQDPYYQGIYKANGIAFSCKSNVIPDSLKTIFKVAGVEVKNNGDLTNWVKQGVFLLNSTLTVDEGSANSHLGIWDDFITCVIDIIKNKNKKVIFVGWGNNSKDIFDNTSLKGHEYLFSSHPSPKSCNITKYPFTTSDVFNKINKILESDNKKKIDWNV